MIKAVIFDFDGVIADTEPLLCRAESLMLSRRGKKMKAAYRRAVLGTTLNQTVKIFKKFFRLRDSVVLLKKERKKTTQDLYLRGGILPVKGAKALVRKLKSKYPLGVATSSRRSWAVYFLKKLKLKPYFSTVVTVNDVKRHKPFPDVYLKAAEKLKVKPGSCLAIEDTKLGIEAAKRAGMKCIALKQPYTKLKDLASADLIVRSLNQINYQLIKSL